MYVWLNSRMYIFQRCFQRENCYLFHIILGSPDTYLYDRHHKYVLSIFDLEEVILLYDQWYLRVIYLHHPYPGAHVKIYIVFRCDTLYLVGNLFNVQFIQSNTMPSWHNWTNIFDTEITPQWYFAGKVYTNIDVIWIPMFKK